MMLLFVYKISDLKNVRINCTSDHLIILTSKPSGLLQSCSVSLMSVIVSCIEKIMIFEAVCHTKY